MCRCVKYLLSTTDKHSCFSLTAEHSTSVMARSKESTVEKHCSMITLKIWEKYQLFDQIAAGVQIVVLILQEQYLWRRSSRELEATPAFFLILSFLFHTLTTRIEISLTPLKRSIRKSGDFLLKTTVGCSLIMFFERSISATIDINDIKQFRDTFCEIVSTLSVPVSNFHWNY